MHDGVFTDLSVPPSVHARVCGCGWLLSGLVWSGLPDCFRARVVGSCVCACVRVRVLFFDCRMNGLLLCFFFCNTFFFLLWDHKKIRELEGSKVLLVLSFYVWYDIIPDFFSFFIQNATRSDGIEVQISDTAVSSRISM